MFYREKRDHCKIKISDTVKTDYTNTGEVEPIPIRIHHREKSRKNRKHRTPVVHQLKTKIFQIKRSDRKITLHTIKYINNYTE